MIPSDLAWAAALALPLLLALPLELALPQLLVLRAVLPVPISRLCAALVVPTVLLMFQLVL